MKSFRINHVPFSAPERLAALIDAKGLSSAAKKFQCGGRSEATRRDLLPI